MFAIPRFLRHLIFAVCAFMTAILRTEAQELDLTHHITSGDEVAAACADKSGPIWLATDHGLTRWGDYLHGWTTWPLRPEPLRQRLSSVMSAPDGRLWVKTLKNYYLIYNPKTNEITDSVYQSLLKQGLELPYIYNVNTDRDRIWIWAEKKVYCLDGKGEKLLFPGITTDFNVKNIALGKQWLYIIGDAAIKKIDRKNGKVVSTFKTTNSIEPYMAYAVEDHNGNIWALADQLLKLNLKERKWEIIDKGPYYGNILCLKDGDIAVSSTFDGVHIFYPNGEKSKIIRQTNYVENSLKSNKVKSIYEDEEGQLWVFYCKENASVCNLGNPPVVSTRHIIPLQKEGKTDDVSALFADTDGTLWVGTDGEGLYRQKLPDGEIYRFNNIPELNDAAITALFKDAQRNLWIGTYLNGLYKLADNGSVQHFLDKVYILDVEQDDKGTIYVAASEGLFYKKRDDSDFNHVDAVHNWVMQVRPGNGNHVFVATVEGIGILDANTLDFKFINSPKTDKIHISDEHVDGLCVANDERVWVICSPGRNQLNLIDTENDTVYKFPELDHLDIQSVVEDGDDGIWALSGKRFVNIKPHYSTEKGNYTFTMYYYNPHLEGKDLRFNHQTAVRLSDGRILQGTLKGMILFNPVVLKEKQRINLTNKTRLAFLKINNQMVATGDTINGRVLLYADIGDTPRIQLNYNENNIAIGILRNIGASSDIIRFSYRLRGLSDEWTEVRNDEIILQNLKPGDYFLEIGVEQLNGDIDPLGNKLEISIAPPFWASNWAYLIYALFAAGSIAALYFYFRGRMKRREALKRIKQESERQLQLNNMKFNFFTNVSHDFRTPLSLIISPVEEMMSAEKDSKKQYTLGIVHRNALRLQSLVNQILDLRKIDAGGNVLTLTEGDILKLAKDVCGDFALLAKDKNIRLECSANQTDGIRMRFDADKIRKVLANLLSNAFKFTPEGGAVDINLTDCGDYIQIKVADTGCGIPDEAKDCVFDMFYQVNSSHGGGGGSGIGLHIVKSLVELHQGTVRVVDNQPKGCVFIIEMPKQNEISIKQEIHEDEDVVENKQESLAEENEMQKTILLVEDNTDLLSFLRESLASEYQVLCATDGREALKQLKNNEVSIIVSDIMMDGMDGLELCKAVRADVSTSHIPIILLTAKSLPADELKGLELGADDYVTKPFHMPVLRLRIRNALERTRNSHEQFARNMEIKVSEITISSVDEQLLSKAIAIVEENINNPDYSVEMLSAALCMHRTNFYKKILAITGKTPIEFIRIIRLKRAYQYIEQGKMKVAETAYSVGFNTPKLFSKYFKDEFGITPSELARQTS